MTTATTAITLPLDGTFFTGLLGTSTTPLPYPVAINGRGYIPDFSFPLGRRLAFHHLSIDQLRTQSDTANIPGETSLNPEGLWRRSQDSWHFGAGQTYLDRATSSAESNPARFRTSKGVNVWTKYQATLLGDTTNKRSSANTNLNMVVAGTYLYVTDSTTLAYSTDGAAYTTVTGTPAAAATSIASDGFNVYSTHVANGMYTTTRGAAAATQLVSSALAADSVVGYVKGRLMVSKGPAIYNITSTSVAALPTALFTQGNTDFVWVGFAEGPSNLYAAGFSGDKSLIYRTGVLTDGTALAAPVVAGELPSGEIVRSIKGYLGNLLIGSDKGVRFCALDSNGNIVVGDLIATTSAVRCFETQDRFVWFGWTNYDTTSSGLGRLDLRTFNDTAPAYASDLMATGQGNVSAVVTFGGVRWFSVQGLGFFQEQTVRVTSGTLDSGFITYGISDPKVAVFLHMDFLPLVGSVGSYLSQDGGTFTLVGNNTTAGMVTSEFATSQALTDHFEVRQVLTRASNADTAGPTLTRFTLRANPAATTGTLIHVPIRLDQELMVGGVEVPLVPSTERDLLDSLRLTRQVVTYQEASSSYTVTVESLQWLPESLGRNNTEMNGVLMVGLKTLA